MLLPFYLWAFLAIGGISPVEKAGYFDYGGQVEDAYHLILQLRLEEAEALCLDIRQATPDNLAVIHLENYIDFLKVYISEDQALYKSWKRKLSARLKLVRKGPSDSPYLLFVQADIRLQWAVARLKFGEYLGAFNEVSIAFQLLKKNNKRFPEFGPNLKSLGILHGFAGSLPDNYRWGFELLSGMKGSIVKGEKELEKAVQQEGLFQQESLVYQAYFQLYLQNRPELAWQTLDKAGLRPAESPLHAFVVANLAMRSGRNDAAILALSNRPDGKAYFPFRYLNFLHGLTLLRKLKPEAVILLERFIHQFEGSHYLKAGWQKRSWAALLFEGKDQYQELIKYCLQEGTASTGEDKAAEQEAKSGEVPFSSLLKARLLFDGGYYSRALVTMTDIDLLEGREERFLLEYHYRTGRIQQALGQTVAAILSLQKTVEQGQAQKWHYACKAALELGKIYEEQGDWVHAETAYRKCLSLSPQMYKAGLHREARTGLKRLEGRN